MGKKWTAISRILVGLAVFLLAAPAVRAIQIISPTEGAIVREKVRIAVARSSVPDGGFISILIDGRYHASVSPPVSPTANVVYYWNTKAPLTAPDLPESERWVRDGKHEIQVVVHDARGIEIESAKVNVRVQNKVPQIQPSPGVKLYYRYNIGDQLKYNVKVRGELVDSSGQDLLGGQPAFTSEFQIGQWIEDVRPDGTALVRYRLTGPPKATLLGQPIQIARPGEEIRAIPPSLYKIIDRFGRTLKQNVFSRSSPDAISDVLVPLPGKPLQIGDKWQAEEGLKIEGLGDLLKFKSDLQLDSLEYESGIECAKISSRLSTTNVRLNLLPGAFEVADANTVNGTGETFFSLRTGKVIKGRAILELSGTVDPNAITNLANAPSNAPTSITGPIIGTGEEESSPEESMGRPRNPYTPYGPSMPRNPYSPYGPATPGAATDSGQTRTSAKLRITYTMELVRK